MLFLFALVTCALKILNFSTLSASICTIPRQDFPCCLIRLQVLEGTSEFLNSQPISFSFAVYWLYFALVIIPVFVAPNNIFWFWIPDTDYFLPYFDLLYWCSLLTYLFFFLTVHFTYKECFYCHQLFTEVCCSM